jgi:hypothetical protein
MKCYFGVWCLFTRIRFNVFTIFSLFSFLFFVESCSSGFKGTDTLLQIGDYKVSVADYEYMRNENDERYKLTDADLEKKIIDDGYLCAYALDNKFDTIKLLNKRLYYAIRFYASVNDGYVWKKKYKQLVTVSEADIKNAYSKKQLEYNIELIYFPDKELLTKYLPSNYQIKSAFDFNIVRQKVSSEPKIIFISRYQRYPFSPFGIDNDKVIHAKPGDTWGPIEIQDGYAIIHIIDIRKANITSYSSMKEWIEKELTHQMAQKYVLESQKKILQKTNPVMHDEAINYMLSVCDIRVHKWNGVDKSKILMNYSFNGKNNSFTIGDFIEYIENEPFYILHSDSFTEVSGIKSLLKNSIMDICLYDEAIKMNMLTDPEFLSFKRNRQFKIYTQYYKEKNVNPKIAVTDVETKKFYSENIDKFKTHAAADVLIYKFKDNDLAMKSMMAIMAQNSKKPVPDQVREQIKSITLPVPKQTILRLNDNSCQPNLKAELIRLIPGRMTMPALVNGEYWVIYLNSKSDMITIPYQEIEYEIKAKLPEVLSKKLLENQITELKSKYQLKTNHIKEYLLSKMKTKEIIIHEENK